MLGKKYTVWVGGLEVLDYYVSKEYAELLKSDYEEDGYDDVKIEEVK
jgi:hypothetical protein